MKGTNVLRLNRATMVEAVQYWLTNHEIGSDKPSPRVMEVTTDSRGDWFSVVVEEERMEHGPGEI